MRQDGSIKTQEINKLIRARKCEYYRAKVLGVGQNTNKLYGILNNLTGTKKEKKLPEGYADGELAEQFLEYFDNKIRNIVTEFDEITPVNPMHTEQRGWLLRFNKTDEAELRTIFSKVKRTFCDSDPFPIRDKIESDNLSEFLKLFVDIINTSIESTIFPESEEVAIVKPIVKGKLDAQCLKSYRPVSNLTFLSKICEKVVLNRLLAHLETVQALPDKQSAYRRMHSTETVLCSVVSDLIRLMDDGKCGVLILLDLSAAFDTVVHDLLLDDCKTIGIDGDALVYLKNYLQDREYCVQIGNSFSGKRRLERGVPQGSVLGPVLFCIYTIGLSRLLENHGIAFQLFADDTQFYFTLNNVTRVEEKLSTIMEDVGNWMKSKHLKLNAEKTECLIVGKNSDLRRFEFSTLCANNSDLEPKNSIRDLGVIFDNQLSFHDQIVQLVRNAGYHLRNIAFVRKYLDMKTTKMLVYNHIISRLDYCNSLYYCLPNFLLRKLQLIMNRAARLITGLSPRERITPILMKLHWLPIKARIEYKICTMVYQAVRQGKPAYLRDKLKDFQLDTALCLRHHDDQYRLLEPRCTLQLGFRAFEVSAPRIFNRLPVELKDSRCLEDFKKKLKTHLFAAAYDADEEKITEDYKC